MTTTVPTTRLAGTGRRARPGAVRRVGAAPRRRGAAHGGVGGHRRSPTPTTRPPLPSGAVGQPAKIEQTGPLGLTVGRARSSRTMTKLTALAGAYGGFVANSQTQSGAGTGGAPDGTITLQVPVDSFAAVLKQAQALGKTSDLTTKATDVTGQYVDLQARITALAGQPPAVPDHPGQGHDHRRRPGRAGAARQHSVRRSSSCRASSRC